MSVEREGGKEGGREGGSHTESTRACRAMCMCVRVFVRIEQRERKRALARGRRARASDRMGAHAYFASVHLTHVGKAHTHACGSGRREKERTSGKERDTSGRQKLEAKPKEPLFPE